MNSTQTISIDCRGQQCPAPILTTAKAARKLAPRGGRLEIFADDDAFPLDVRSWCRSAGAELMELSRSGNAHRAVVLVKSKVQVVPPSGPTSQPQQPPDSHLSAGVLARLVDCRGMQCPAPILAVARAARDVMGGSELEILADDDAFELDIKAWCRSSGANLDRIDRAGMTFRARVRTPSKTVESELPGGRTASDIVMRSRRPSTLTTPAAKHASIDLRSYSNGDRLLVLDDAADQYAGQTFTVLAADSSFTAELLGWCTNHGHKLISLNGTDPVIAEIEIAREVQRPILRATATPAPDVAQPTALVQAGPKRCTLLVLHNDKEALLAALLVANGAAAQGMDVMMFFTFWGLNLLRGEQPNEDAPHEKVSWVQRLFKWLMPKGPKRQKLSKLNFAGMGGAMMNSLMRQKNIMDLTDLMAVAHGQGVRFVACTMSMDVMGITKRDLQGGIEYGGVTAFVESAASAELSLVF